MSKNPSEKREVILLEDFPRSGTPEPAPKRQRTSRSSSTRPGQDSSRSQVSRAGATKRPKVSQAGATVAEESSSAEPVPPPPSTSSSNQPPLVAMDHLAIARSSRDSAMAAGIAPDPSDRKSEEADTEARPGMTALTSRDPSDRESPEADSEARPAMGTIASKDPADRKSEEADAEARPAMRAMRSGDPTVDQWK